MQCMSDVSKKENKFSVGPLFESVDECPLEVATSVQGQIPKWISGALVRNGPGKFEFGEDKYNHWFDGASIIHKFSINNGLVTFQSRFLESETYKKNSFQQRIAVSEFGTVSSPDPCASKFSRLKSWFFDQNESDNPNINVLKLGDALLATTDSPHMKVLAPDLTIDTHVNMSDILSLHILSAHPHVDADGTTYFSGSSFNGGPKYHIVKVPAPQPGIKTASELLTRAEIVATIPSRSSFSPSYSHSFGMTENYFIYCETPVCINLLKVLTRKFTGQAMNTMFHYDPTAMALFHVIRKSTGEVLPLKFQVKGLFFFHTINCYEEDEHLVMDVCSYSNFEKASLFTESLEEFRNGNWIKEKVWESYDQYPVRVVFPLHNDSQGLLNTNLVKIKGTSCEAYQNRTNLVDVHPERLLPRGKDCIELPQINYEKFNGRKYQYFYGTGMMVDQHFRHSLGKVDVRKKTSIRWAGTVNQYPSEPVFLSHPNAQSEDDGVVLSTVCDTDPSKQDFLLILNAKTFAEIGRAYVPREVMVPYSIHGSYHKL